MLDFIKSAWITIAISILTLLIYLCPLPVPVLEFNTQATIFGQPLQLVGCHLLHWSGQHLFWDLGMFLLLGVLCERICRRSTLLVLAASAVLIPPIVGVFHPAIETYRGLSGIDTALFGMATISIGLRRIREQDLSGAMVFFGLLAAMMVKIGHEIMSGSTLFVEGGNFVPVPVAHVIGAAIGIAAGFWSGHIAGIGRKRKRTTCGQNSLFDKWRTRNVDC